MKAKQRAKKAKPRKARKLLLGSSMLPGVMTVTKPGPEINGPRAVRAGAEYRDNGEVWADSVNMHIRRVPVHIAPVKTHSVCEKAIVEAILTRGSFTVYGALQYLRLIGDDGKVMP